MGIRSRLELRRNFREHGAEYGANVPEEMPGVLWNPKGGERVTEPYTLDTALVTGSDYEPVTAGEARGWEYGHVAMGVLFDKANELKADDRPLGFAELDTAMDHMSTPEGMATMVAALRQHAAES